MEKLKREIEDLGAENVKVFLEEYDRGYSASFNTDKGNYYVGDLKWEDGDLLHKGLKQLRENCLEIIKKDKK